MTNARERRNAAILTALNERHTGVGAQEHTRAVAQRFGVAVSTVYKVKQNNGVGGVNDHASSEPPIRAGQAPTLLRVLQERGRTRRGWAEASPRELVGLTGIDIHDITKTLHQLRALGIVKYREGQGHDLNGRISAIRLTQKGVNMNYELVPPAEPEVQPVEPEPGLDATADEEHGAYEETVAVLKPTLAEYPLLRNLVRRKALLLEAGKAAEAAGAEDVAITLYDRAEKVTYTPEQQEMIRFLLALYPGEGPLPFETPEPEPVNA